MKKELKQILIGVRNGGFITPAIEQIIELFKVKKKKFKRILVEPEDGDPYMAKIENRKNTIMEINIGEIVHSITDIFEDTGERRVGNPENTNPHIKVILKKVVCKLCGEELEIQSSEGAMTSGWDNEIKAHLELHIKDL